MLAPGWLPSLLTMATIDFTEYGRLAEIASHPRDARPEALIEEQLAVTLSVLHHHHIEEDAWLWPWGRQVARGDSQDGTV